MTERSQPSEEREQIEARLAVLYAAQEAATSWGAAVGARHEEAKELERRLAALKRSSPGSAQWELHHQPKDQIADHEFSIWLNGDPVILANTVYHGGKEHLQAAVDALNAALPVPDTTGTNGVAQATVRVPEWRDYAEKLDEHIRKDGSEYSLALAAIIEVLENVEAALAVPSTDREGA